MSAAIEWDRGAVVCVGRGTGDLGPQAAATGLTGQVTGPFPPQLFAILAKTPYGHEKKGVIGIDQLLADGVFNAAFPLHDVSAGRWLWGGDVGVT